MTMDIEYAKLSPMPGDDDNDDTLLSQPLVRLDKIHEPSSEMHHTPDVQTMGIPLIPTIAEVEMAKINAMPAEMENVGTEATPLTEHVDHTQESVPAETKDINHVSDVSNDAVQDEAQIEKLIAGDPPTSKVSDPDKGYVIKGREVSLDLQDNLFSLNITSSKRKEKDKLLSDEKFDTTKKRTSGFLTCRPVRWLLSFEVYEKSDTAINCRFKYKINSRTKKYTECQILLYFDTTKSLAVNINFITGTIMLHGADYKTWVQNEFPKLQILFSSQTEPDLGDCSTTDNFQNNVTTEIENLWSKNEELVNSIKIHDDALKKLTADVQELNTEIATIKSSNVIKNLEAKFDAKLKAFTTLLSDEVESKLSDIKKLFLGKIEKVYSRVDQVSTLTQKLREKIEPSTTPRSSTISISNPTSNVVPDQDESVNTETFDTTVLISVTSKDDDNANETFNSIGDSHAPSSSQNNTAALREPENPTQPRRGPKTELVLCFDSNGKFVDRKKLWKVNSSDYFACSMLSDVSRMVNEKNLTEVKYFLLNVGLNDIDDKDHNQVFQETETLINQLRNKYPGIKIIISELIPRKDNRNVEVEAFNSLLAKYASKNGDITIARHANLRDSTWSMHFDDKHIKKNKIPKFAANIIRAMKISYNIKQKRELFTDVDSYFKYPGPSGKSNPHSSNSNFGNHDSQSWDFVNHNFPNSDNHHNNINIQKKLEHMANYQPVSNIPEKLTDIPSSKLYELQAAIQKLLPPPSNNIPFNNSMRAYWPS